MSELTAWRACSECKTVSYGGRMCCNSDVWGPYDTKSEAIECLIEYLKDCIYDLNERISELTSDLGKK